MPEITRAATDHFVARHGGKCRCCGETTREFIEVVPVERSPKGRGRRPFDGFKSPVKFYKWLEENPDAAVEVLCANCNAGIELVGVCAHETGEEERRPHNLS